MLYLIPPSECSRARESVSCRLDGELSELEAARLDDHLRDCAECSAFAREMHALSSSLRFARLEQPQIDVFASVRRRPLVRLRAATAAAAIVAVAAGSAFAVGRMAGTHGGPSVATVTAAAGADFLSVQADSAEQHILAMVRHPEAADFPRVGRVIAV